MLGTEVIFETAQKFAPILSAWIVTELDKYEVTTWNLSAPSQSYLTFDPEVFIFLIRETGEEISKSEYPLGVQFIDLISLREQAQHLCDDDNNQSNFEHHYNYLYTRAVLQFWMFDANLELALEKCLHLLDTKKQLLCIKKIREAYEHFTIKRKRGSIAEKIIEISQSLKAEELSINSLYGLQ